MTVLESSPVRPSLYTEMTTLGVDDWLFIINTEVAVMMVFALRLHQWVVIAVLLHFVLMMVTKLSPRLMECYFSYMRQSVRYWPARSPFQKRGAYPAMFTARRMR